ncbi:hypothetical protein [Streptomyces noursei]|uniref:hypothetical protein n=1 Tax=Streptomyces noursei TaxID=1971 RepID=UPI001676712E|nr:hypothetical protein [Streptomyces noursei]MCZ1015585.1 hypothetical protein [Streptomyces noursei]
MTDYSKYDVAGLENGGVDVFCLDCDQWVAGGGCSCCLDQDVRISDLIKAADAHTCPSEREGTNG